VRRNKPRGTTPVKLGDSSKTVSTIRRQKMSSKKLETVNLQISWSNIEAWIAAGIQSVAKGTIPEDAEIKSIKLDYPGGYVAQDKVISVEVILRKGVEVLRF